MRPPAELRRQVFARANDRCEYCLTHQSWAAATHQVDHVIAEKHGGGTILENLALSCTPCNLRKGSDVASIDPDSGMITALYHPRTHSWSDHFRADGLRLVGLTPAGRATLALLKLNSPERLTERLEWVRAGIWPPSG